MRRIITIIAYVCLILSWQNLDAAASKDSNENIKLEYSFSDWHVYTTKQEGRKICYVASDSLTHKIEQAKSGSQPPYVIVTNISQNIDEVSLAPGYKYKVDSRVELNIDGKVFELGIINGDVAWARDAETDSALVIAMRSGKSLVTKSEPADKKKGSEPTQHKYSLIGFTKAYKKMKELCAKEGVIQ